MQAKVSRRRDKVQVFEARRVRFGRTARVTVKVVVHEQRAKINRSMSSRRIDTAMNSQRRRHRRHLVEKKLNSSIHRLASSALGAQQRDPPVKIRRSSTQSRE